MTKKVPLSEEIRYVMLYYYRKGKNAAKTARKICDLYGPDAVSTRTAQEWFSRFRSGNFDVKDAPRSGRPSINTNGVIELVEQNRELSCKEIADTLNLARVTVWDRLKKSGYKKGPKGWVLCSAGKKKSDKKLFTAKVDQPIFDDDIEETEPNRNNCSLKLKRKKQK